MKKCPVCKMMVDAENECPICNNTITYEPLVDAQKENLKFNKYLLLYLLKHSWLSLICLITVIIRLIITKPNFDMYSFLIILFTLCSIIISLIERKTVKYALAKYSFEYSVYAVYTVKALFGILAVIFSFIMW